MHVAETLPHLAVMVAVPFAIAVTMPLLTVAMLVSELLQTTVLFVALDGNTVAERVSVSSTLSVKVVLLSETLVTAIVRSYLQTVQTLFTKVCFARPLFVVCPQVEACQCSVAL